MSGKQFTNEQSLQLSINPISQMKRHSRGILFFNDTKLTIGDGAGTAKSVFSMTAATLFHPRLNFSRAGFF